MRKVWCLECGIRFRPRGSISAKKQLEEHAENDHLREGEQPVPMPRPTDEQAIPSSYEERACLACGETVRDPHWNSSLMGGSRKDEFRAVADNPIRKSKFWTKRKVTMEISTWVGTGAINAKHYYGKLEEDSDHPIIIKEGWPDKDATVWINLPYNDPGKGRRIDAPDGLTEEEATQNACKTYLEAFDCRTHYLVLSGLWLGTEKTKRLQAMIRTILYRAREGD